MEDVREQFWGGTISHFFPSRNILIVFAVVVVEASQGTYGCCWIYAFLFCRVLAAWSDKTSN